MAGVLLVILIQYIHFKTTGSLWQPSMNLGYIVAMPLVPQPRFTTFWVNRTVYCDDELRLGGSRRT